MSEEREKLIEELKNSNGYMFTSLGACDTSSHIMKLDKIADFILADRKRIVEPQISLKNYLREYSSDDTTDWKLQQCVISMLETLKLAGIAEEHK